MEITPEIIGRHRFSAENHEVCVLLVLELHLLQFWVLNGTVTSQITCVLLLGTSFIHSSIHKRNIFDVLECTLDAGESAACKTEAILSERSADTAGLSPRIITECHRACFLGELNPTPQELTDLEIMNFLLIERASGMSGTHICQHLLGTVEFQALCWWFSLSS